MAVYRQKREFILHARISLVEPTTLIETYELCLCLPLSFSCHSHNSSTS